MRQRGGDEGGVVNALSAARDRREEGEQGGQDRALLGQQANEAAEFAHVVERAERDAWRTHSADLQLDAILDTLVEDLRARGRLTGDRPAPTDLALQLIDEYVRFPPPAAGSPPG